MSMYHFHSVPKRGLEEEVRSPGTGVLEDRCELLMYAVSIFFLQVLRAMSFPLRTVFILSHKFGYGVASFSLNSKNSLLFLFLP